MLLHLLTYWLTSQLALALQPSEAATEGWLPVDADGLARFSALGLFPDTGTLAAAITAVQKFPGNPLFNQTYPWEPRLDNGYPNVVYDPQSTGDGPWRLWYGGIGTGGQYLYYANSSDGLQWEKPLLDRYDLGHRWPALKSIGKRNNVVMFGGGLGVYHDLHEPDPALRYKISGGSPAGCYSDDGNEDCVVGTAGSPDGINNWTAVEQLPFSKVTALCIVHSPLRAKQKPTRLAESLCRSRWTVVSVPVRHSFTQRQTCYQDCCSSPKATPPSVAANPHQC